MGFFKNYQRNKQIKERKKAFEKVGMEYAKPSKDIKGAMRGQGMYIGGYFNENTREVEALMDNGSSHCLVVAPTRAGKGVGIVLPTMLTWTGSSVVHDIKRELWTMTSGHRKAMGQKVLKFDPVLSDGSSVRFNPFEEIRIGTLYETKDVQNIAEMLMNPTGGGKDGDNAHWTNSAIDLAMGFIMHLMYDKSVPKNEKNLGGLLKHLSLLMLQSDQEAEDPAAEAFKMLSTCSHAFPGEDYYWTSDALGNRVTTHPKVREMAGRMLAKGDRERASVISSALANLALYADPIVSENTSFSEFKLDDLMNYDVPVNLYLVAPPNDAQRIRPLFRLIVTQILNHVTADMKFKDGSATPEFKYRLLFMMDEFASLGKIDQVPTALTFAAGYGVKFCGILQTTASLKAAYGQESADVILANCHTRVFFSPNDMQTAKDISEMCGKKKVLSVETSASGKRMSAYLESTSISQKEEMIDLITPAETLQMPKDELIVMHQGVRPIRGRKFYYFKVPEFVRRSKIPQPEESDRLIKVNKEELLAVAETPAGVIKPMSVAEFLAKVKADAAKSGEELDYVEVEPDQEGSEPEAGFGYTDELSEEEESLINEALEGEMDDEKLPPLDPEDDDFFFTAEVDNSSEVESEPEVEEDFERNEEQVEERKPSRESSKTPGSVDDFSDLF